jgi:phosphoribosylglycinamide formyltransferase 1
MPRIRIGVLASGRGSNLQALIDSASAGRLGGEIVIVISDAKDAQALERSRRAGISACYVEPGPSKSRLSQEAEAQVTGELEAARVDLVALAGFMRVLSPGFVRRYLHRIMNIHPSLLPAFPGLRVQKQALEYGVKIAGCTVHFVDEGVDTGPIIIQAAIRVLGDDTEESLSERILREEHRIYSEAVNLFAQGRLRIDGRRVIVLPEGATLAGPHVC